ncbi:glycerol-3-phosphate dehydrogenase [NAD(P)+] [Alicyclobacillus contaminans]|uniref:NAD(P)H-dependent glycerol-3-phosphate dehydrogenase n=1 Tax=Alicyclobacillus contaminans TaxID=392016 RepID=UPI00040D359B|nr:NAD(P)H-dependent glycerol-3-phosphate dehydrogenase [Alicyclobacillus contaminans]GMA52521.1 glycerol-3-phosphate dehydrogenase [NAD(P)+] [Alicyclobacillus contaminans]
MNITVLGAGSWGTALASVLCHNGHRTTLWVRRPEQCREINERHTNVKYLPDARLPEALVASTDLHEAVRDAQIVIFSVPSQAMPEVVRDASPLVQSCDVVAHAVKGFDVTTGQRMSQLILSTKQVGKAQLAVITGPSHAEEVVAGLPTTVVVAAYERATAELLQDALMNPYFRVYTNPDVVGAELAGSLKNIIALGVGMADGLGFGDNAKAALMTRGLAEMARLGMKMGASPLTFAGLSGVGDLIVTCTSQHSRNFRAGRLIGSGFSLEEALGAVGMVVEGVRTVRAAVALAERFHIEMPIANALYDVLFTGKKPSVAVEELMGRERGHEVEEVARELLAPKWDT